MSLLATLQIVNIAIITILLIMLYLLARFKVVKPAYLSPVLFYAFHLLVFYIAIRTGVAETAGLFPFTPQTTLWSSVVRFQGLFSAVFMAITLMYKDRTRVLLEVRLMWKSWRRRVENRIEDIKQVFEKA